MNKFGEITASLDKALEEVKVRKDAFEKASTAVSQASNDYAVAVETAQVLRKQLTDELNAQIPEPSSHVTQSK